MQTKENDNREVWREVESLFSHGQTEDAIRVLERYVPYCSDLEDLSKAARKLAHLYRFGSSQQIGKAASYALLAGQTYVRMGRLAPAVAMVKWLRELNGYELQVQEMERMIRDRFARVNSQKLKKSADDEMPPPTPFQELQAFATTERDGFDSFRVQFRDLPPKRITLFSTLTPTELERFVSMAVVRDLAPQAVLFREGDDPLAFYVVADGEMKLLTKSGYTRVFREGEFFGEVALLGSMKRTATLMTETGCKLLEFSARALAQSLREFSSLQEKILSFFEWRLFFNVAGRIPFFEGFADADLEEAFGFFTPIYVAAGRTLIKEGDESDRFYFIVKGQVDISRSDQSICRLSAGHFVGEMGVLRNVKRTAKVTTMTDCHLLECHQLSFRELCQRFPNLEQRLKVLAAEREVDLLQHGVPVID